MPATGIDLGLPHLAPQDQYEVWRQTLRPLFDVDVPDTHARSAFEADIQLLPLGDAVMSICASQGQSFSRTMADITSSGWDHIVIQNYTRGGFSGVCGDTEVAVEAGDINVLDLNGTLQTSATDFANLTLVLPRARLPLADTHDIHGAVISRSSAIAPVIAQHMKAIAAHAASLSDAEIHACLDALCLMLSQSSLQDAEAGVRSAAGASLRARVAAYIESHLADPRLDPERIASACRVSRASLYRLFTLDGGVMAFIVARRLDRAFETLGRPGRISPRLADLAGRLGFSSETHLSRAFRSRFGMTPREARRLAQSTQGLPTSGNGRSPSEWVLAMRHFRQAFPG